ncbi:MAG TPA: hypothetical protein VMU33_02575 [Burkholderiaceae bacterium]|nr:hypothetical protein [Burkholderiaceae bacterium]
MRFAALVAAALLAACSPRFDWRDVRPAPGGFVVALPDRPQTVARDVAVTLPGGVLHLALTMTSTGVGATLFAVGVAPLPPAAAQDADAVLAWFRDGIVRNLAGTVTASRPLAPPPGATGALRASEELVARGTMEPGHRAARLDARLYVFEDRLYSLAAVAAEGELPPEARDTFFDSFRIAGH